MNIKRKFYVGHPKVTAPGNDWAKATYAEAVKHAKKVLEAYPDRDHAVIVKVVAVVRRQQQPLIVEKV